MAVTWKDVAIDEMVKADENVTTTINAIKYLFFNSFLKKQKKEIFLSLLRTILFYETVTTIVTGAVIAVLTPTPVSNRNFAVLPATGVP